MSSTLLRCRMAVAVAFVEGQVKMEFFRHTGSWLLLVLGREGGGGSLLYRAGAGTQSKLCVLHTQISHAALLREKELWMPCLSP